MHIKPLAAAAGAAYLAALLALDHFADYHQQLALGVLTWCVLLTALLYVPVERRAQTLGVVCFATIGELTGSIIWGVYHYRLHNLPLFVPPAHGIVYLTGLSFALAAQGVIDAPQSRLGRYLARNWERVSLQHGESLVYWLRKLIFRGAWLDHQVKRSALEIVWVDREAEFAYQHPGGGRPLLELAPVPSWHELQFRP